MSPIDLLRFERNRLNKPPLLKTALLAFSCLLQGLTPTQGYGEPIVIGGGLGTLAWDGHYSEISVIDFDANPGQIQPAQTGPEDNIALKIFERGGAVTSPNARIVLEISQSLLNEQLAHMVSGDTTRAFEVKGGSPTGVIFRIDLGERLGINRIKFFPRKGFEEFLLKGYELLLNDGSEEQKTLAGTPDFKVFRTEERNLKPTVDLDVPLQFVRFIEVKQLVRGEWEIDEFQVFGAGFASTASYTSRVFDQEQPAIFGDITWARGSIGEPTKTDAILSTRSGNTPDPSDSLSWSAWSSPYPAGVHTAIESPAPRRFFQFHLLLKTSDILAAATVDSLAFEVSPALADSLVGEIWPQNAMIGQNTPFTYAVRTVNSRGFNRLELKTMAPVDVVRSVQINETDVEWEKTDTEDGAQISFPRIVGNRTLRVVFENVALQYNTFFAGRVSDSQKPDNLSQVVTEGDAVSDFAAQGDDLSVEISVGKDLIHSMKVTPVPFTPNGDGLNDEVLVTYDIVNLTGGALVAVEIYDLSGRRIKEIYSGLDPSRRYQRAWDGTDESGAKVLPGIYLMRVEIDADSGFESKTKIVPIVY